MKLLVIEDEMDLCDLIKQGLVRAGYAVDSAYDGEEGLELAEVNDYDLIILDLNLPGMDGMEILRSIRNESQLQKVLILSARSEVYDKITGLDAGANDYLVKPFHFAELEARVRSLLRRNFIQEDTVLEYGSVSVDTVQRKAYDDGMPLKLTRTELSILEYLLLHRGETVSTEQMIEHIYDSETDLFSNAITVHIHTLRKKLSRNIIRNVRGIGYRLQEEEAQ